MASGCPVPLELQGISRPNAKPILIVSIWYYEVKNWRWIFVSKWVPVMNSCPCATLSRPRCLHGFELIFNTKFLAFKTYYCHILCFSSVLLCCTRHCVWMAYSPIAPGHWETLCIYFQPRIILLWLKVILVPFSCLICSMFISHTGSLFMGPFHGMSISPSDN